MTENLPPERDNFDLADHDSFDQMKLSSNDNMAGIMGEADVEKVEELNDARLSLTLNFTPTMEWDYAEGALHDEIYNESRGDKEPEESELTYYEENIDENNNESLNDSDEGYEVHSKTAISGVSQTDMGESEDEEYLRETIGDEVNKSVHAPITLGLFVSMTLLGMVLLISRSILSIPILLIGIFSYVMWNRYKKRYGLKTRNVI